MHQLPGSDSIFLSIETPDTPAHTGGLLILDPSGVEGFGFERLKQVLAERIDLIPKFRSVLREVPLGLDRPYWTPCARFDVADHLNRVALPSPGGMAELTRLCAKLFPPALDRRRPLWEIWYIEGLQEGRVALFARTHHCLMDGVSGADLGQLVCDLEPDPEPRRRGPRPPLARGERVPGDLELTLRGLANLATTPRRVARYTAQALRRGISLLPHLRGQNPPPIFGGAPRVSFNDTLGPRRAFAFCSIPLARAKAIRKELDVKLNDLVLALCGGAVRRYLIDLGELPAESLVVGCPVSTRDAGDGELGNRLATMQLRWATELEDPIARLRAIHEHARDAKEVTEAARSTPIQSLGDTLPPVVIGALSRAAMAYGSWGSVPFNAIVSNVQGPPIPLYTAGARIEALYPISVLTLGSGLNVTALSYRDRIDFGLVVDPDLIPEPEYLADGIPLALEELESALERQRARPLRAVAATDPAAEAPAGGRS